MIDDLEKQSHFKLCASFQTIGEFKLELQSDNSQIGSKLAILCPVWPYKLTDNLVKQHIGHLFYVTSSFVHHFVAIGESNRELQSGIAQCRSKIGDFLYRV